ncbi:MAG: pilus assembly protein [Deltaproteobacteria bacterium]|nr:pilus assembly protein [Deltaproteobacteria bacterium]
MRMCDCLKRCGAPGQAFAEFALVGVVFLLLMFALMELAAAVFDYATISEATREAARYAIAHSPTSANPATNSQIQQIAINAAPSLGLTASNVSVSWPADSNMPSKKDAQITISYPYKLQLPLISPVTLTLAATSQSLVSQ